MSSSRARRNWKFKARTARPRARAAGKAWAYLLLKADAAQIPLATSSVDLVIATPPFPGERRFHQREFCTSSLGEYEEMIRRFVVEAARIVRPSGYILLQTAKTTRLMPKIFDVLQKRKQRHRWVPVHVRTEKHFVRNVGVKNFYWEALPVQFYRELMSRYSRAGDTVVHVFSGSGNGGLAAIDCGRKPILIDLCYHTVMKRRLEERAQALALSG